MSQPPDHGINVRAKPLPLFETPVIQATLEGSDAMIAQLETSILARRALDPGLERSNDLGWHSASDMSTWGGQPARALSEAAVQLAARMTSFSEGGPGDYTWSVTMWANVSPPGALNLPHTHPGNLWAAVFWVDPGGSPEEDIGGELYFEDPRFPMAVMRSFEIRHTGMDGRPLEGHHDLTPRRGDMVVFPAWLRHGVRRYRGARERISVAMNLDLRRRAAMTPA